MKRLLALSIGTALLAAAGPAAIDAGPRAAAAPGKAPRLKAFGSCPALVAYAERHGLRTVGAWGFGLPGVRAGMPVPVGAERDGGVPGVDYSETNVQEAGVDEPDIVKTDGARILAIAQGKLHHVDVRGPTPRLLGSLALEQGFDHQLLVSGDRALVVSTGGGIQPLSRADVAAPIVPFATVLAEIDVSDPAGMRVVRTLSVDGAYVSARLVGSTVRVVLRSIPGLPLVAPKGPTPAAERAAKRRNRAAIASSTARSWLPRYVLRSEAAGRTRKGSLVQCRQVRYPKRFSGLGMLTVLTIDLAKGIEPIDSDAVMTDGEIVYASKESLYVATQRWIGPQVLSRSSVPPEMTTALHKFDISEPARTEYRASGRVSGFLLNQWSLSEHGSSLRVASTTMPLWWLSDTPQESESLVTVLEERSGELVQVGQVGGLGRGERIFGVRFIADVGYVVTFRQVDPLYTIDLSDPAHPAVAGELKILGYSAYLHPVGEGLLLGVGQDATEEGRALGTQVSLFDVSDPGRPTRLERMTIASGSSEAEFDHRAFLYWPKAQLAVLPVLTGFWAEPADTEELFVGAIGVNVDRAGGLRLVGKVSHRVSPQPQAVYPIRRSLVVGETLYTLSEAGLKASSLETLADRAWVAFPQPG